MLVMQHCFGLPGSGGPVGALERLQEHSDVRYPEIRQLAPAGGVSLTLLRDFVRKIRARNPSLLHVRGLGGEGFHGVLAGRIAGVPHVLVSIHGTHRDLRMPRSPLRRWVVVNTLERATLSLASHIATVHPAALERDFLRPYRHKLVGAVPNGVVVPQLLDQEARRMVRERFSIEPNAVVGVCVSRLVSEKGYLVLAEALQRLKPSSNQFNLLVVGDGDESGEIQRRFACLSGVRTHFVGHQSAVLPYLRAADFFVQASLHENLSNALLEAMAAGLPVIATSVGGTSEVLARGGGVLVPPDDPEALGIAIGRLCASRELRALHGLNARENIEANYSVRNMVEGWRAIYERILGDAR